MKDVQPVRSEQVRTWAADRFQSGGGTVEGLVAAALDRFCQDGDFVREFVVENLRAEIVAGVTGLTRTREMQAQFPDSVRTPQGPPASIVAEPVRTAAPAPRSIDPEKPPRPARVRTQAGSNVSLPAWAKALAPDAGRRTFRPLLALTREELLEGAGYLAVRSDVLRGLADRLKPGQRVSDAMGERELNELVARLSSDAMPEGDQRAQKRPALAPKTPKPHRESFVLISEGPGPEIMRVPVSSGAGEP